MTVTQKLDYKVYYRAAELIESEGWVQGTAQNPESGSGYCAGGAIAKAVTGTPGDMYYNPGGGNTEVEPYLNLFADYIGSGDRGMPGDYRVCSWNDSDEQTKDRVILRLRVVAQKVQAEQEN